MRKQRLLKLAKFLDTLPKKEWNFSEFVSQHDAVGCGTVCCAIGWCPKVFPRNWEWTDNLNGVQLRGGGATLRAFDSFEHAAVFFDISVAETVNLFSWGATRGPYCRFHSAKNIRPQHVAAAIREFVWASDRGAARCGA